MANITKVYLLSVPLEKDYQHTLYFQTAEKQQEYFLQRVVKTYSDFSYQRKDNIIRLPDPIDDLYAWGINYVMYQNSAYGSRWFYAFVTDMTYINDGRTDLTIQTDCIQTWMFDVTVKKSFVEREHAASDELGEHTIPEGLEMGEYTSNLHTMSGYGGSDYVIVLGVTKTPDGKNVTGVPYEGIYSGVRYYSFPGTGNGAEVNEFLAKYDDDGIGEAVVCMFLAPKKLAGLREDNLIAGSNLVENRYINYSGDSEALGELNTNLGLTTNELDGYVPRNMKLKTFPYRYLLVTNNAGASVPFKYERFFKMSGTTKIILPPEFIIEGCVTPGCSIRMTPLNYNGAARNDEEGVNMGKYPILNWTSDVYTNWLTQNGVNIALQVVSGAGQIIAGAAIAAGSGGLATAVGGGSVVGGVNQITGTLAQIHQQSFAPPQAKGNLNAGDAVTAAGANDFHFYDMSIKKEYARLIDEYFDMYGYKCHRVKTPEANHRENYWYTKTIDANIVGAIPQDDLQTIKDCYNRGITFWRNTTQFRNYGVPNGIV